MLWMGLFFPCLTLEREPTPSLPRAVVSRRRGRRIIVAVDAGARTSGIDVGSDAVVALAREPTLQLVERSPAEETRAIKALAAWALQFSAEVCFDASRWILWMEIGASIRYFDGLEPLCAQVRDRLATLGYTAQRGIAPTLEGAALFAREGCGEVNLDLASFRAALASKPLSALAVPAEVLSALKASGLQTIREVLALPAAALARRFGHEVPLYLRKLTGVLPDPRPRFRAREHYRRHYECSYPITTVEGLLFPLRRLLQELQGFLRGRDKAVQRLRVCLQHREAPPTLLELRTSTPMREAVRLFALLRERLERTTLTEPVTDIRLAADELLEPAVRQSDFFDAHAHQEEEWTALLDKLRARLGENTIRELGLADDYRPERAWVQDGATDDSLPDDYPERPLWLLEAKPLDEVPILCGTPERIEAGWWTGEDSSRDYYLARTPQGARWWLYRDVRTRQWYLQGIWG